MDLLERVIYLCIGIGIGFILGIMTMRIREIKEEVDEVRDLEKRILDRDKDERGSMKRPRLSQIGLLIVVLLSFYAAYMTGQTNGNLDHTITCVVDYNEDQGKALTGRDQANKDGTASEIKLWTLYEKLYKLATEDPKQIPKVQDQLTEAIIKHRDELLQVQKTRESNPYPDPDFVTTCKE